MGMMAIMVTTIVLATNLCCAQSRYEHQQSRTAWYNWYEVICVYTDTFLLWTKDKLEKKEDRGRSAAQFWSFPHVEKFLSIIVLAKLWVLYNFPIIETSWNLRQARWTKLVCVHKPMIESHFLSVPKIENVFSFCAQKEKLPCVSLLWSCLWYIRGSYVLFVVGCAMFSCAFIYVTAQKSVFFLFDSKNISNLSVTVVAQA